MDARMISQIPHKNIALMVLYVFLVLATSLMGVNAETKYVEIPSWDFNDNENNPLDTDSMTVIESQTGIIAPSTIVVKGNLSNYLKENEHIWIAVKPYKSIESWWPQTGGPLALIDNRTFEGNAFLGGTNGDRFEVAVLIIEDQLNDKFLDWINFSKDNSKWPPITEGHQGANHKVLKEEIEAHKYASITVILMDK